MVSLQTIALERVDAAAGYRHQRQRAIGRPFTRRNALAPYDGGSRPMMLIVTMHAALPIRTERE